MMTAAARGRKAAPEFFEDAYLPDPPTPDEVEFDTLLEHATAHFDLRRCGNAAETAWRLGHGLLFLESLALDNRRLSRFTASEAQRDRLCVAIITAACDADDKLPPSFDRKRLSCGMAAAYGLAYAMAEPSERRLCEHPDLRQDARDHMRRLRNGLHDLVLEGDIENRRRERERVVEINRFRAGARTHGEA